MNVLILDDIATSRKLLRAQLEREGLAVVEAADGVEGLAKLKAGKIDAAISDVLMRGMDGYRFCHEVRQNEEFRNLPIIMYTVMRSFVAIWARTNTCGSRRRPNSFWTRSMK